MYSGTITIGNAHGVELQTDQTMRSNVTAPAIYAYSEDMFSAAKRICLHSPNQLGVCYYIK